MKSKIIGSLLVLIGFPIMVNPVTTLAITPSNSTESYWSNFIPAISTTLQLEGGVIIFVLGLILCAIGLSFIEFKD